MAPLRPPLPLNDDVTAEIFFRLPPDEPEHLFRAALVCKSWLGILCDRHFLSSYRAFHGAPPLLGFLLEHQGHSPSQFISTTSIPELPHPVPDGRGVRPLDFRHGRLLTRVLRVSSATYFIWDPVTGHRQPIPSPYIDRLFCNAAVFCVAKGCDHLRCNGGPFRVAFLVNNDRDTGLVDASVYSSETGAWSAHVSLSFSHGRSSCPVPSRPAVVGDGVYFTLQLANEIVKYSLRNDCLSVMNQPPHNGHHITVMGMGNTSLGFACIEGSRLYTWSRSVHSGGATEWVQFRVIEMEAITPIAEPNDKPLLIGYAEGVGITFITTVLGLFMVKLNSGEVKKIAEPGEYYSALPYLRFYTPDRGRLLSLARDLMGAQQQ